MLTKRLCFVSIMFIVFQNAIFADFDGAIHLLKTFIAHRHVQTVTVDACWSYDFDKRLLKELSSVDISVYFGSSVEQTQGTWYRYAILVDVSCKIPTHDYFRRISEKRLFNTQTDWIVFGGNTTAGNTTDSTAVAARTFNSYLADAYVLPDSGVFLFQEVDDNVWTIWNGFRASKTDQLRVFGIGSGSPNHFNVNSFVLNEQRNDFLGVTLKSTTVIVNKEHYYGFNKKISSDLDVFAHLHYGIVNTLSYQLNFKMDLSIVNDYGWSLGNGSFSGLTGLLQTEAIDFSAAGVLIRQDRMDVIDYTVGTIPLRTVALFRQPPLSSVHNILSLPFTSEVWSVILVTVVVFVITLVVFTRAADCARVHGAPPSVQDVITLVHGAVCQQGAHFTSNFGAVRVVVFILFSTFLFVFTSYSACIAALIQSNSNSIASIRDIVESPMTFSVQITPYAKRYFEETDDANLKKLYRRKIMPIENQAFTSTAVGMGRIRTEFHGFLVEMMAAYRVIGKEWREEEKCGLSEIELFKMPLLSVALVKKSGHKDIFKQKLIQQMETGLSKRIFNQWISPKPSCGSSGRANQYVGVSIADVHLPLKVFGYGVCVSLAVFALEMAHHARSNRRTMNIKSAETNLEADGPRRTF